MASTSNQIGSSSSSFTPRWNVFLSFRGADTRGNFTGHLYKALDQAGIQTFMDDTELPRGEEISPALLKAIQESDISIVVISKNYASSTWCLDELMKILECRKTMGQLVLPVFYKVNPSDVRYQCGRFAEAFEKHKIRFLSDMNKVEKWRATLTEAAQLSGYHVDANGNEPNLIDQIVDRVQIEVNPRYLNVAKKPVGIASHVENVMPLLSIGTNGVRKIGIYGMGGVGKTTVAKAVYNENFRSFQGNCFLANVREVSGQLNGIVKLQKLLLSEVLKSEKFSITNVDNGISFIEKKIQKRVLIVLDDLDHRNQLDSLAGQWNRFASGSIIMITTRDERLLDQIKVDGRYKVEELNNNDSLELFSLHAFGKTIPPSDDFMELSQKIIGYAGGLPLALEVFGSNLFNQDELRWRYCSLECLPSDFQPEKLVFLDLRNSNINMLCNGNLFLEQLKILDLMGCEFLKTTGDISGLASLEKLLLGDCTNLVEVHPSIGRLGKLVCLDLSCCSNLEGLPEELGNMESIRVLKVDNSSIVKLPDSIGRLRNLVELNLRNCRYLINLPSSIGQLRGLERLILDGCINLESLPEELGKMERLTKLEACNLSIKNLPDSIGQLSKLDALDLSGCRNLRFLPGNICNLRALRNLKLDRCLNLETLPQGLGNIESLEFLDASRSMIIDLPYSIGRLTKLSRLDLSYCQNLENLPISICNLRSLQILDIDGCSNLERLPEDVYNWNANGSFVAKVSALLAEDRDMSWMTWDQLEDYNLAHHNRVEINGCPRNWERLNI